MFENLDKNVKNWKYYEKGQPHACDYRMDETARICSERFEKYFDINEVVE